MTKTDIIFEDWKIESISDMCFPVRGGSPRPAGDTRYFNGTFIPWLTVAALTNIPSSQIYVSETESGLTEAGSLHSRILEEGTIIIANSGATLGIAKILSIKCCANDGIAALLDFNKSNSKEYLVHFINSKTKYLREVVATGNGQPNLNTELIGLIQVTMPSSLAEQTAIATAISDMDALIAQTEKLIEKKKGIKQGVMQRLLSAYDEHGKLKDGWVRKRVCEVCNITKGSQINRSSLSAKGEYPVYNGGINPSGYTNNFNTIENTIIISEGGNSCGYVNYIKTKFWRGGHCYEIQPNQNIFIKDFAFHLLKFEENQIMALRVGSGLPNIQRFRLNNFSIYIPSPDVQRSIAKTLDNIFQEIESLLNKLQKLEILKQAMMQCLLTGKIRIYKPKHEPTKV